MSGAGSIQPVVPGDRVTVVGLGKMGVPMARNLRRAGYEVVGYDVAEVACARARDQGLRTVGSLTEASAGARLVLLMVGFDEEVLRCVEGPDGVLSTAPPGRSPGCVQHGGARHGPAGRGELPDAGSARAGRPRMSR